MTKKIVSIILSISIIALCFAGCSSKTEEKYSDTKLIIGYIDSVAPFLDVDESGKASGFIADVWASIFDDVKGDLTDYTFEKVEEGYKLEESGGFFNENSETEYSAGLLMGAVYKNSGTFNEDYSFSEPLITNRIISITAKDSDIKDYSDFAGKKVVIVNTNAFDAYTRHSAISESTKNKVVEDINEALKMIDDGKADILITDEFTFMPLDNAGDYNIVNGEIDTIEYVIACAKYSGWKNSINEAVREMKSEDYGDGDIFTPLVEKYFGYNASSFEYTTDGDK